MVQPTLTLLLYAVFSTLVFGESFTAVEPTPLNEIVQIQPAISLELNTPEVSNEQPQTTATLTNRGSEPLQFDAYFPFGEDPLMTTMTWEKQMGEGRWEQQSVGFCGTGLGTFVLEPGSTVMLVTPHLDSGGTYRFVLRVKIEGQSDPLLIYSNAVEHQEQSLQEFLDLS